MGSGNQTNYFVHTLLRAHHWQHRPQFDQVCDWWRAGGGGGRGVCALVGMGGAGKTAIAERFLRVLPGGLPEDPDLAKDKSLPRPHSTFVFSFYVAPNPESFFEALQMWLEGTPRVQTVLSVGQLLFLLQKTSGLVLLDGLEKVQDDGSRGVFGRLSSPKLRDFLDHLAGGFVPNLSVLVTSRFPLADLRDARPQFFRTITIDQIDLATGVQLLRDRGVHGNDLQLEPIDEQRGRHALTVDLAGGYIKEFGQGDPATPLNLGTAQELQAEAEQEPDDDKRAVLKQGIRFARIAQRYREAMLNSDEAAIALLERICLFRLGVDCASLAAIFTGKGAIKVSGKALAGLNTKQLKKKLDWLVRMRIVEANQSQISDQKSQIRYYIHPAVRDGFLSGIGHESAQVSHEAVRQGLEVSLGEAPGENPSDPATLDLLEEIVHHTLQSGHVDEAWETYQNRIGGFKNLGWRLGAYERGERICRAFAGGQPPESIPPLSLEGEAQGEGEPATERVTNPSYVALPESEQARFINEWALYLDTLGRLAAAARCYELGNEPDYRQENWIGASIGNRNLCGVLLLSGRLSGSAGQGALSAAAEALRLAELADVAELRASSHAYHAHARALRGEVPTALADFRDALDWQHKAETHTTNRPLWSIYGIMQASLLARLGRREEATRLAEANKDILTKEWGADHQDIPKSNLVLSDLPGESLDRSAHESLCRSAHEWAVARDAKEVLCWSALVQARIELSAISGQQSVQDGGRAEHLAAAETAVTEGLKIAGDCGYGLHHIDLLLECARLHLHRGHPQSALDDIRLALDDGISANDQTGQPELLAANHKECGYAWGIAEGLHIRGEALLLKAAQQLGRSNFAPANMVELAGAVPALIDEAYGQLKKALGWWHKLRDPESDAEIHPRGERSLIALNQLQNGILTSYPLHLVEYVSDQIRSDIDAKIFDIERAG